MGEIIDLAFRRPPAWGAFVEIASSPNSPGARLSTFWGNDGLEVPERCRLFADALRRLADDLDATAVATEAAP